MNYNLNFFIPLVFFAWGLSCFFFPHWWYKKVSPEQMAHDQKVFKTLGCVLAPLGIAGLLLYFLS
jgi:hypothetical protein